MTYPSLQILEQRSRRPASDRKKLLDAIANGGPYQDDRRRRSTSKTHVRGKQWGVGQWQGGEFVGIAPADLAGRQADRVPEAGVVRAVGRAEADLAQLREAELR